MKRFLPSLPLLPRLVLAALLPGLAAAEEPVSEKAQRYYDSLLKRPVPGPVFDRFYTAWLETRTTEELAAWLEQQANAPDAPPAARLLLAYHHLRQGDNQKAIAAFRTATAASPENAEAWLQQATAEARSLDFDSALASLDKAAAADPPAATRSRILQLKGRLLARSGKAAEAVKTWQELIAAAPDDEELKEDLIELQLQEGLTNEALATAESLAAATTDPYRRIQRRLRIGDIHQRAGNREKAVATYLACLEETGTDSWLEKEILSQLDQTFRRDDAIDALVAQYRTLTEKFPQRTTLRRRFAALLVETGATDEAVRTFNDLLAKTPGNREIREAFTDLLLKAGKADDAASQLRELIRLNPQDVELTVRLADLLHAANRKPEAKAAVSEFLAKSDQSEAAWLRAASLLERFQLTADSLETLRKAAAQFPESEAVQDALAVSLHKSGSKEEAFAVWRKLAASTDKNRVLSVARSAAARDELTFAADLLTERLPDFPKDPLYLLQLCETAERTDRQAQAVPWARTLVSLASDPVDLEAAMTVLLRISEKAGQTEALLAQLKTEASSPQDKCLLAELLDRTGDPRGSEATLKEVEASSPELAIAILVRLQSQRGDLAGAAASMKRLVESPSGRKSVHVQRLTELYERAGKLTDALAWIPEWKKLSPGSNLPWQKEASLHLALGNSKDALRSLREASQEFDDNEDLKAMLAEAYRTEGKFADASRLYTLLYEEAKELSAKIRWAAALAETARDADKLPDLIEQFEERRKANRTSLLPILSLAEIHRVAENYEARAAALAEAARIKAGDLDILLEIARIAEAEGDFKRALETLREAEPLDPSGKVRQRIARVHFASGDTPKGMAALEEFATSANFDARQLEALADALCDQELWKEAATFLAPRVPKFPADYRLHYLLGCALEESEQPAAAASAFLHILSIREDLPSPATTNPQTNPQRDFIDSLRPYVPADAIEILSLSYGYQAYQYRNNRSARNSAGLSPTIPAKRDEARSFALVHLASLAQQGDDNTRSSLTEKLRSAGLSSADLIIDSVQGNRIDRQIDLAGRIEKEPQNETLLALAALWGNQQNNDPATDLRVYQGLRGKRPELSWLAAFRLISDDSPEASQAWLETAEALGKLEVPPPMVLNNISALLQQNTEQSDSLPDRSRDAFNRLRAKLPGWYRKADPRGYQAPYIFIQIAGMLSREENLAPLVSLMEDEVAAHEADPQRSSRSFPTPGGRPPLLESLSFPPQKLPEFSPLVLSLLNSRAENYYGSRLAWDEEKLKSALPAVKNPTLKLLLLSRMEDGKDLDAALKAATEPADAPLDILLLAASRAAETSDWESAGTLLRRAQPLPMSRDLRRLVDGSLVTWSLEAIPAGSDPSKPSPLLEAGREALLRLRREASNAGQRQELADAMKQLGMDSEADRMTAAAQAAPQSPGSAALAPSTGIRMLNLGGRSSRVDQLVAKGKRDDALRELTRELRNMAKAWLSGNDALRYQAREWVEAVNRHGFAPQLTTNLDPGPEASPDATAQWAAALDIMGEPRKAANLYQKALAAKPKDAGIRKCLLLASIADDPEKAVASLKDEDAAQLLALAPNLSNILNLTETHAGRFSLLEMVVSAMEKAEGDALAKSNPDALFNALDYAFQQGWANRDQLDIGSLYQQTQSSFMGNDTPEAATRRAELQNQRLAIHRRASLLFLKIESTARRAFQRFAAVALTDPEKYPPAELDASATAVLELERSSRRTIPGQRQMALQFARSDVQPLRQPDPEEWLLERAWKENKPEKITAELLPKLRSGRSRLARDLEEMMPLYFCSETDFPKAALEFAGKRQKSAQPGQPQYHWLTVFHVADLRKLDADFAPLILDGLRQNSGNFYGGQEFWHVMQFARRLLDRSGPEATDSFFREVAAAFLGPIEKRPEFLAKNYNPRSYSSGSPNARIMQWLNLMRTAWQSPDLVFPAAETYVREFQRPAAELAAEDQFFNYGNAFADQSFFRQPAEKLVASLGRTTMVRPLDAFLPCAGPVANQRCLSVDVLAGLSQAASQNKETRTKLRDAFAALPRTFGSELIDAALAHENSSETGDAIRKVIAPQLDAIRKLPQEAQQDFAAMILILDQRLSSASGNEAAKSLTAWATETSSGNAEEAIAAFLKPRTPTRGLQNTPGDQELSTRIVRFLNPLARSKPAEATAVFLRARSLVSENRKAGMPSQIDYGDGSSVLGYVLSQVAQPQGSTNAPSPEQSLHFLNFVFSATTPTEGFPVEWRPELQAALGSSAIAAATIPGEKPEILRFDPERMAGIATAAGANLPALAAGLVSSFAQLPNRNDDDDRKLLAARASAGGPDQAVAALIAAAETFATAKPENGDLPAAGAAPLLAIVEPWLRSETVPLALRLSTGSALLGKRSGFLTHPGSPDLHRHLASLLASAWQQQVPVPSACATTILSAFSDSSGTADLPETDRPVAESLLSSWGRATLARQNPRGSFNYRGPQPGDPEILRLIVPLALRLNDDATLAKLMASARGIADSGWFHRFVISGRHDLARRIFRLGGEELFGAPRQSSATWLPDQEKARSEFLAGFDSEEERFSAATVLASIPDSATPAKPDAAEKPPTRKERLRELAARMPATFRNPLALERCLGIFLEEPEAIALAAPQIDAWAAQQTLGTITQVEESQQRSRRIRLFTASLGNRLEKGDLDALCATMEQIGANAANRQSGYLREAIRSLYPACEKASPAFWKSADAAGRARLRKAWRAVALVEENQGAFETPLGRRLLRAMLQHAADDRMDEFAAEAAATPKRIRTGLVRALESLNIPNDFTAALASWPPIAEDTKVSQTMLFLRTLDQPIAWPGPDKAESPWFSPLVSAGVFKASDLVTAAPGLMKSHPREGRTAMELAVLMAETGQTDQAMAALDSAQSSAPRNSPSATSALTLTRAEILDRATKFEEALAALQSLPEATLAEASVPEATRNRISNLSAALQQQIAFSKGGLVAALDPAARALNMTPENLTLWKSAAVAFETAAKAQTRLGKHSEAVTSLSMAWSIASRLGYRSPNAETAALLAGITTELRTARIAARDPVAPIDLISLNSEAATNPDNSIPSEADAIRPDFDDSSWPKTTGPAGWGSIPGSPGIAAPLNPASLRWLRFRFKADPARVRSLLATITADDACAIWLNGNPIHRVDLPPNSLTPTIRKSRVSPLKVSWTAQLKEENVLAVALCQSPQGIKSGLLSLTLAANDFAEPTEAGKSIDMKETAASLGAAWTQFPDAFREAITAAP
jgi:tetratricopeptide (TPR) repeat protein